MENKNLIAGVALLFVVVLTLGCVGQAPTQQEETPEEGADTAEEVENGQETAGTQENETSEQTEETDTNETDTETEDTDTETEDTEVEKVKTLSFKMEKESNGELEDEMIFHFKNMNEENGMIRIERLGPDEEFTLILHEDGNKGWYIAQGQTIEFSTAGMDFEDQWKDWENTYSSHKKLLVEDWESGDYTYTEDDTTTTISDIEVNQDIPDSTFQPS